jgi:hypothetical protein
MSIGLGQSPDIDRYQMMHPLVKVYAERLSEYVGFLSRFIVQKQYLRLSCVLPDGLDEESAMLLCRRILTDVQTIVGPLKSLELETDLMSLTKEYYEGGPKNER